MATLIIDPEERMIYDLDKTELPRIGGDRNERVIPTRSLDEDHLQIAIDKGYRVDADVDVDEITARVVQSVSGEVPEPAPDKDIGDQGDQDNVGHEGTEEDSKDAAKKGESENRTSSEEED